MHPFLVANLFFLPNQISVFFENLNFYNMKTAKIRCIEVLLCMEILRCLSGRLETKMLKIHLFNIVTMKTPWALATLAPVGL